MRVKFFPEPLLSGQKLAYMGLEISDDPQICFNWNWKGTIWQPQQWDSVPVINRECLRTDKSYVDKIFKEIYGYSSQAEGVWAVEKPDNTNGFKDCKIVNNLQRKEGRFYQRPFIDCTQPESNFKEYRITIMNYRPVITLIKHKTVTIDNLVGKVNSYEFTSETPKVEDFCRAYPLEYGELDGCYFEGKFWIYDVNPTPGDAAFTLMPSDQSTYFKNQYKHHLYKWLTSLI